MSDTLVIAMPKIESPEGRLLFRIFDRDALDPKERNSKEASRVILAQAPARLHEQFRGGGNRSRGNKLVADTPITTYLVVTTSKSYSMLRYGARIRGGGIFLHLCRSLWARTRPPFPQHFRLAIKARRRAQQIR